MFLQSLSYQAKLSYEVFYNQANYYYKVVCEKPGLTNDLDSTLYKVL